MLRSLDASYYKIFSKRYGIDEKEVLEAVRKTKNLSLHKIKTLTEVIFIQLKDFIKISRNEQKSTVNAVL